MCNDRAGCDSSLLYWLFFIRLAAISRNGICKIYVLMGFEEKAGNAGTHSIKEPIYLFQL